MIWDILSITFIVLGLILDSLNLRWGYLSACGKDYKSGMIIIPAVLYIIGILILMRNVSWWQILALSFLAIIFHALCCQIVPIFFDKLYARRESQKK